MYLLSSRLNSFGYTKLKPLDPYGKYLYLYGYINSFSHFNTCYKEFMKMY